MNTQRVYRPQQQGVAEIDNKPALAQATHLLLRLKTEQAVKCFDFRSSIKQIGELLRKYSTEVCNDNISVLLRDFGFKITKIDFSNISKVKSLTNEQLSVLHKDILVNEFDQSPLREPIFLGDHMAELADFVGERAQLEEYLKLISVSIQSLKVHAFATDILAWAKPIAAWAKQSDQSTSQALIPYPGSIQSLGSFNILGVPGQNEPSFEMPALDPVLAEQLQRFMNQGKIKHYDQLIRGGLTIQKLKRHEVEHRHGAIITKKQNETALVALQSNLDGLKVQMDGHKKHIKEAIETLQGFQDKHVDLLNERNEELGENLQKTFERLLAEEKRADQLHCQVASLTHQLQAAWSRVNEMANDDGGWCSIQ